MTASHYKGSRWRARVAHGLRLFSCAVVCVVLAWLCAKQRFTHDFTTYRSHSLAPASIAVLEALESPLRFTAYLAPQAASAPQVERLFRRYLRHRPQINMQFIDPLDHPEALRSGAVRKGEIVISNEERSVRVSEYSEQALSEGLARLARKKTQWLVSVTGHGERRVQGQANHDISAWAAVLARRGYQVQELNLATTGTVPDNTDVLILASPQLDLSAPEVAILEHYIASGGNVLWLTEPDAPASLAPLATTLGFQPITGTIVDPLSLAHGIDNPAYAMLDNYADHPSLAGFQYTSIMFYAAALAPLTSSPWTAQPLIYTSKRAWSETEVLDGQVAFDKSSDSAGPLAVALALTRPVDARRQQKVVVVGDGDFLANSYLGNSGNQDLGVRLVEWLADAGALLNISSRTTAVRHLQLKRWQQTLIGFFFLLILPAALVLNGLRIWWRRRRA